ncbi:MAG: Ig-like domain-containing protein [Planctomycetia bacterium]|nr:Ig-like domain-containing protein [Planctomycetia bacterium]
MHRRHIRLLSRGLSLAGALAVAWTGVACGGGGSAGGGGSTPAGIVLVDFLQRGQDNVPLNRTLEFVFSDVLDPDSVKPDSFQIRVGPAFGPQVTGIAVVEGPRVRFEPRLPGRCDLSDGGLQPDTDYRVTVIGHPEQFAVRSIAGDPLERTVSEGLTFHTRAETDPELFEDARPGVLPSILSVTPADGTAGVPVGPSNAIEVRFSENLDPCTVTPNTVSVTQVATGPFNPVNDQTPGDPGSWGSGTPTLPARTIRCDYEFTQTTLSTRLRIVPRFGEWPDNAQIVVRLDNTVTDFGGNPLPAYAFSFTTEDRPAQTRSLDLEFGPDVAADTGNTTAELDSARSASRVTGFLLVAGDGDNGPIGNLLSASGPGTANGDVNGGGPCSAAIPPVANDGALDDFDPPSDVNLSTGATRNTCRNSTDGSAAVVFEYRSFRIRSGVTVRLTGVNPAIILVRGDLTIEAGGRLLARGDGGNGAPLGTGQAGNGGSTTDAPGGVGVAGGGSGGVGKNVGNNLLVYGGNGHPGYGSTAWGTTPGSGGDTDPVLQGAGRGGVGTVQNQIAVVNRFPVSGGGGGHATIGGSGTANGGGSTPRALMSTVLDGAGGSTYGAPSGRMPTAEAGSGGGGGGSQQALPANAGSYFGSGGGGGAGGGFVDLTAQGNIRILGTVDAQGSRGGNGGSQGGAVVGSGAGGGGGSGGGIRLLTPGEVVLGVGAVLTATGGAGGTSLAYPLNNAPANNGGAGGVGRIVIEDADSIVSGLGGAMVTPGEGAAGFYRGVFDATRFQGGGLRPTLVTRVIDAGPFAPVFLSPTAADFVAGIPLVSSRGMGRTTIFIEAEGFAANADGTASNVGTGWRAVGHFVDSGAVTQPTWVPDVPPPAPDVADVGGVLPGGVTPSGFSQLAGMEFVRFRVTFFLPSTMGPFDAGSYLDRWSVRFTYDQ